MLETFQGCWDLEPSPCWEGLVTALFPKWWEPPRLQACSLTPFESGACSHQYPIILGRGVGQLIPVIYGDFLFPQQSQKIQPCPTFAHRSTPPPQPVCCRLQWPAVTQCLPQAVEEGRPPAIPAWLEEEKPLPATPNRNKLNYASGETRKKHDSRPLKRASPWDKFSFNLLCSVGRGQMWCTVLPQEPRKVVLSLSVVNVSSVITGPEREKDRIAVQRAKHFHNFSFPPFSVHHPPLCCQRKEAPRGYPLPFLNSHDFAASDPLPPVFNRGYENQAACSLFVFSDLLCVLPAARAMAFPNTGHHSELWVHPGLTREVQKTAAKLSLCKKDKVKDLPRFTVFCVQGTGGWA